MRDLKQETSSFVGILVFDEQLKFRAQLNLGPSIGVELSMKEIL